MEVAPMDNGEPVHPELGELLPDISLPTADEQRISVPD